MPEFGSRSQVFRHNSEFDNRVGKCMVLSPFYSSPSTDRAIVLTMSECIECIEDRGERNAGDLGERYPRCFLLVFCSEWTNSCYETMCQSMSVSFGLPISLRVQWIASTGTPIPDPITLAIGIAVSSKSSIVWLRLVAF
jgi:hypothetical protein